MQGYVVRIGGMKQRDFKRIVASIGGVIAARHRLATRELQRNRSRGRRA
jgi:hypothetical protein